MNQIEKVARAKLVDELALAIDQFLTHQIERDTLACDLTQDELTELATGLAPIAAMPVQTEPVAWMYEYHPKPPETRRGAVEVVLERITYELGRRWTETPLYAHPPAQWTFLPTPPAAGGSDAE